MAKVTSDFCGKQKPASEFAGEEEEESRVSRAKATRRTKRTLLPSLLFFFRPCRLPSCQKWHLSTEWSCLGLGPARPQHSFSQFQRLQRRALLTACKFASAKRHTLIISSRRHTIRYTRRIISCAHASQESRDSFPHSFIIRFSCSLMTR